jgi:hypothetical protein
VSAPAPARRGGSDVRLALVLAALMLAIPLSERVLARFGWTHPADFSERSLMLLLAAYLVLTGNSIPKRLVPRACRDANEPRVLGFLRFAGWTWVLAGLAFGAASVVLSGQVASQGLGLAFGAARRDG